MSARPAPERSKVLFVTGELSQGGAERFVSTALAHIDRSRFEPHLSLFRNNITYDCPEDVTVAILGPTSGWNKVRAIRALAEWMIAHQPDVVVGSHWHPSMFIAEALRRTSLNAKHVCWVVSNPAKEPPTLFSRLWALRNYPTVDRFVAVSQGVAKAFCEQHKFAEGRTEVLYNPVDMSHLEQLALKPRNPSLDILGRPMILALGRLHEAKRFDVLIDAFGQLSQTRPKPILVILGEGNCRSRLERQIKDLSLTDDVYLPGFAENPYPWIKSSEFVVSSSDFEGFPVAMTEAQSLGKAVVSTDCDFGPREIIEHRRTGFLVPTGRAEPLKLAIEQLLSHPHLAREMGAAATIRSRELFDVKNLTSSLSRILSCNNYLS